MDDQQDLLGGTQDQLRLPPLQRDEAIIPPGQESIAQRELYSALIGGFAEPERHQLEDLMIDNIERLRSDGDSYAP